MSGRWFTTIAVAGCLALVAFAVWTRSRGTAHIRAFWGAHQARLIQHAPKVLWHAGAAVADSPTWSDLSHAPGLVHLRATLVDDRYFQWSQQTTITSMPTVTSPSNQHTFQFTDQQQSIELTIDVATGMVLNVASGQAVPLISSSQQALAAYLPEVTGK